MRMIRNGLLRLLRTPVKTVLFFLPAAAQMSAAETFDTREWPLGEYMEI